MKLTSVTRLSEEVLEPTGILQGVPKSVNSITEVSLEGFPPVHKWINKHHNT